jgi:hypothetical protein
VPPTLADEAEPWSIELLRVENMKLVARLKSRQVLNLNGMNPRGPATTASLFGQHTADLTDDLV